METVGPHPEIQTPSGFRLLPGERILYPVVEHPARKRDRQPSSLEQMLRLTQSTKPEEIGAYGPSWAALSFDTDNVPAHLDLYKANFGRDGLRVAIDLITSYPELARATILSAAQFQGVAFNTEREEEPGRIAHEIRNPDDPIAVELTKRLGWGWPYYGSVDATPEFIRTLTAYTQRSEENHGFLSQPYTDRSGEQRTISYAFEAALAWIEARLKKNPEGLLEYQSILPRGIENQVWKDSWDAYHHKDGTLANHSKGIASIEVQVTTFDALIDAAELFEDVYDQPDRAAVLREKAAELRRTILEVFWTNDEDGYFVLGTDRDENNNLRQLKLKTSNMGHVLNSRLLKGDDPDIVGRREATVSRLFSPELLASAGIRTLASDEVRFRPGAYHCGSVWLWDTHHIAKGLRRLDYGDEADELDRRVLAAVEQTRIFPEYVRGDEEPTISINTQTIVLWDEVNGRENKVEQPPQEVQAWSVAATLAIKKRLARRGLI
ncbi:MAG: hypothetical protein ABIQ04_00715 [Candidatus Saccharimonadales bacterium]